MRAALVLALLVSSTAAADTDWIPIDRVVAVVNREPVFESHLRRVQDAELQTITDPVEREKHRADRRALIIETLIDETVVNQQAKRAQITLDPTDVDLAIKEIKTQNGIDDAGLEAALTGAGYTMAQYRVELGKQLMRLRLFNLVVRPRIVITDIDTRALYESKKRDGTTVKAYDDMKADLTSELFQLRLESETRFVIREWRADSYIEVKP